MESGPMEKITGSIFGNAMASVMLDDFSIKNKIKILRSYDHQIKKNGRYFISYINVIDQITAKNLCNEIKLNKLDCLIKTS